MATLTPTLTLTANDNKASTAGPLSNPISISVTATLTTTDPSQLSRKYVVHSGDTVLQAASTGAYYLYIKNISSNNSKPVDIKAAGGNILGQITTGEFAFIPVKVNIGVAVAAVDETVLIEYGIFKRG